MKKFKIVLLAAAAVCGVSGAYAKVHHARTVEYIHPKNNPNAWTALTQSKLDAGFICQNPQLDATCTYTSPSLTAARAESGLEFWP